MIRTAWQSDIPRRVGMRLAATVAIGALALLMVGCGNSDDSAALPTSTATRTITAVPASQTPTRTPTSPAVSATPTSTTSSQASSLNGLIVLQSDFSASAAEAGTPPSGWTSGGDVKSFDKALAHADWSIGGKTGVTAADGQFEVRDLSPGRYSLEVQKSIGGNLLPLSIPVVIGDGASVVVVEVGQGLVRTQVTYNDGGVEVHEIDGPYRNHAVIRDGRLVELSADGRTLVDADGNGSFDGGSCQVADLWSCPADRRCSLQPLDERFCQCVSSCPVCDDCGLPGVCVSTGTPQLYRCSAEGTCSLPGDRCVCVPSCPDCRDCAQQVCVPSCDPVEITAIVVDGPAQIMVGRQDNVRAHAQLSDGSTIDVTTLVTWTSSDEAVASVSSWGQVSAHAVGTTELSAALGTIQSAAFALQVVERPTLLRISIRNTSCYCGGVPLNRQGAPDMLPPCYLAAPATAALPFQPPGPCRQVVLVGGTIQFVAIGEFADNSVQDVTREATWSVEPAQVGAVDAGLFTGQVAGSASIIAAIGDTRSDATDVRVVSQATVESLSIYPSNVGYAAVGGGALVDAASPPCFDCGAAVTVLRGDKITFQATAHYDTGEWREVTNQVTWRTSNASVATIGSDGVMNAVQAGTATIDATLDAVTSNPVGVRVVSEATLLSLSIYQEGLDRTVFKGDQRFFHATGYYDVGFSRDVTAEAQWKSTDETIGSFEQPGVFVGKRAGDVRVRAELGGQKSDEIGLEVFETSELAYCDANTINRNVWADDFNRVVIESDCGTYAPAGLVTLRYTVTETAPHGGIFDPCLDLYVYQGERRVRTIREEGCGDPFLAASPASNDAALKYQLRAVWDLKEEGGQPVAPGRYTIFGRFYLYYDPVVHVDVIVTGADGGFACEPNNCGNGCGYVHACGDSGAPTACPAICRQLCECPGGWGISGDGRCEACTSECCPQGAACAPGMVRCEPKRDCCPSGTDCQDPQLPVCPPPCCALSNGAPCPSDASICPAPCCNPGEVCADGVPACDLKCCPPDVACVVTNLPSCPCCSRGAVCIAEMPPCPDVCCPPGAACLPNTPSCEPAPVGTATPIPPVCTPPACATNEVFHCLDACPGGCGTVCATPTPSTPKREGACYIGSADCTSSSYHPTIQEQCCDLYRLGAGPAALSWCAAEAIDADGKCTHCAATPCDGIVAGMGPG